MSQVETTKSVAYVATGPASTDNSVSKVVAYFVLVPGEIVDDGSGRQGHVHTQIVRR